MIGGLKYPHLFRPQREKRPARRSFAQSLENPNRLAIEKPTTALTLFIEGRVLQNVDPL
jgi:hypothetical protein